MSEAQIGDLDAFRIYMGIRLHFQGSYDFVTGAGRLNWLKKAPETRSDFKMIGFLMKKTNSNPRKITQLCFSNMLYSNDNFLYDDNFTESIFKKHLAFMGAVKYNIEADLTIIEMGVDRFGDEYVASRLSSDVFSSRIRRETLVYLYQKSPRFFDGFSGYGNDQIKQRIQKAVPFLPLDESLESAFMATTIV